MGSDLSGKAAIVTGSSRGIGRAIAMGLAARGAAVTVSYLKNAERADEVVRTIRDQGGAALAVPADLSQRGEVTRLFDTAEDASGR